jgi:hypothetical protein
MKPLTQAKLREVWSSQKRRRLTLLCLVCKATYSASPNDYFAMDPGEVHSCVCGGFLVIVQEIVTYRRVWPKRGGP